MRITGPGLFLLLMLAGCRTAMTMTVVNRGPTLTVTASCGDQQFQATLSPQTQTVWQSSANNCAISTEAPARSDDAQASRDLTITTSCQHDHSCGFQVGGEVDPPSLRPGEQVVVEVRGLTITRQP